MIIPTLAALRNALIAGVLRWLAYHGIEIVKDIVAWLKDFRNIPSHLHFTRGAPLAG